MRGGIKGAIRLFGRIEMGVRVTKDLPVGGESAGVRVTTIAARVGGKGVRVTTMDARVGGKVDRRVTIDVPVGGNGSGGMRMGGRNHPVRGESAALRVTTMDAPVGDGGGGMRRGGMNHPLRGGGERGIQRDY